VTKENFLEWRQKFNEDMKAAKLANAAAQPVGLTGMCALCAVKSCFYYSCDKQGGRCLKGMLHWLFLMLDFWLMVWHVGLCND